MAVHTLDEAMERLRKNHHYLCRALKEARENPAVLEEWRRYAQRGLSGGGRRGAARLVSCGYWRCPCGVSSDIALRHEVDAMTEKRRPPRQPDRIRPASEYMLS